MKPGHEVTRLLRRWQDGDPGALESLMPLLYEQLRGLARPYIRRERAGHTLQTTALVNEAYLQLVEQNGLGWETRAQFFALSAQIMRHILVDHARQRVAEKRGGKLERVTLDDAAMVSPERASELVALDDALQELQKIHPRGSKVVELRYFGGMNNREAAAVLDISDTTVERDWRFAKAWLYRELAAR
jgi:RNA polymerase sigma-70 factor, ECF subfamily